MNSEGRIFVISGPSGTGKGTVIAEVMKTTDNLKFSVSATTRQPRPGEVDGINYYFITKDVFLERVDSGEMLEYTEYNCNFYGTPLKSAINVIKTGSDVLLDIEVKGAANVKRLRPDCVMIFLSPPTFEELERRLRGRKTDTEEQILRRLAAARIEMNLAVNYDYIVVNGDLKQAVDEVKRIILSERNK